MTKRSGPHSGPYETITEHNGAVVVVGVNRGRGRPGSLGYGRAFKILQLLSRLPRGDYGVVNLDR